MANLFFRFKYLFFFSYLFYVFSVSWEMWDKNVQLIYWGKHFFILLPAAFVLFILFIKRRVILNFKLFFISTGFLAILFPYLFRGLSNIDVTSFILFVQQTLFLLSAAGFSYLFSTEYDLNKRDLLILGFIFFIPLILNVVGGGDFIYNLYYGRGRLLLGYFHPKEAGISLLVVLFIYNIFIASRKLTLSTFTVNSIGILLLLFIDSRNCVLMFLNFIILNYLLSKFNIIQVFSVYVIAPVVILFSLTALFFSKVNVYLSYRLTRWFSNSNFSFIEIGDPSSGMLTTFHIDNFYLEYLLSNGILFWGIFVAFLVSLIFLLNRVRYKNIYVNSIFISFLIFCFFDSGMFSSGNFLNIFSWSFVMWGLNNS